MLWIELLTLGTSKWREAKIPQENQLVSKSGVALEKSGEEPRLEETLIR